MDSTQVKLIKFHEILNFIRFYFMLHFSWIVGSPKFSPSINFCNEIFFRLSLSLLP